MTNPTGTQWETALLNELTSNGERIALIESSVARIEGRIETTASDVAKTKQVDSQDSRILTLLTVLP